MSSRPPAAGRGGSPAAGHGGLALGHAVLAADWEATARLLDECGLHLVLSGDHRPVDRALQLVPEEILDRPPVSLVGAVAALNIGDLAEAQQYLNRAEVGMDPSTDARVRLLYSAVLLYHACVSCVVSPDISASVRQSMHATTDRPELELLATANRGMIRLKTGDFWEAEADLKEALRLATHYHFDFLALGLSRAFGDGRGRPRRFCRDDRSCQPGH